MGCTLRAPSTLPIRQDKIEDLVNGRPTIGRIVLYTLTASDAGATNKRCADARLHQQEQGPEVTGAIVHTGNEVSEGDVYPMVITRVWGDTPASSVNGQVFLDGNDLLWVTSVALGTGPRTFAWPTRS
jgi:hypothetical protein